VRVAMIGYTFYEIDARVKRAAEALADAGHHVDLYSIKHETAGADRYGKVRVFRLGLRMRRSVAARYALEYGLFCLWAFAWISLRHLRRRYDAVYVHNLPNFVVFAGLLPKLSGAGVVLDVHDPAVELLGSIRGEPLPGWMRRLAWAEENVSLAFADAIITVNESMRRRIVGMCGRPVLVVMNLPDPGLFFPRTAPGPGTGSDTIVYSGSITLRHGVDLLVEALAEVAGEFPTLRLLIIGAGPAVTEVREQAASLGVADRVEIMDYVANDRIPALVSGAAAGVAAQREDEFGALVFSMKVAEYAALGLPVVCSGITTMRHYFTEEDLFFFEPGDPSDLARAIRELLKDPAGAAARAAQCQRSLLELDWPGQRAALVQAVEQSGRASRRLRQRQTAGVPVATGDRRAGAELSAEAELPAGAELSAEAELSAGAELPGEAELAAQAQLPALESEAR
jgi:glycosyltransferase involved in cell wall biosynthesis